MAQTRPAHARYFPLLGFLILWLPAASSANAQGSAFTYQGKLTEAGNPANGNYDMQFKLFDTPAVGTGAQQGSTITNPTVQVAAGIFTVTLDFGSPVFDEAARYLEIGVRPAGNPNPHTILSPRQQITSSPYAIQTINTQQLGGLPASRYVKSDANGNVAIGTGTPAHRLAVLGGPCWTGDCWGGALELENASAIAWRANSSGTQFGIGRTNTGLFFFHTNSPPGTTTNGPIYDFKMDNNGNVGLGNLGINTDLSGAKVTLATSVGYGVVQTDGTVTVGSYVGGGHGWYGTRSNHKLSFFTNDSIARMTIDTAGNVAIGTTTTLAKLSVEASSGNGIRGATLDQLGAGVSGVAAGTTGMNVGVFGTTLSPDGYAGSFTGRVYVSGNVGIGTEAPLRLLHVNGRARVGSIPLEASAASVCFNGAGDLLQCGLSSLRLKTNVQPFGTGLDIVRHLRPISFNWKEDGRRDIGLGAEDVAKVAPSFTFTDSNGAVAGVKYERLNMLLINAIKEQQQQIEEMRTVNDNLNARLGAVEKVCGREPLPGKGPLKSSQDVYDEADGAQNKTRLRMRIVTEPRSRE